MEKSNKSGLIGRKKYHNKKKKRIAHLTTQAAKPTLTSEEAIEMAGRTTPIPLAGGLRQGFSWMGFGLGF